MENINKQYLLKKNNFNIDTNENREYLYKYYNTITEETEEVLKGETI